MHTSCRILRHNRSLRARGWIIPVSLAVVLLFLSPPCLAGERCSGHLPLLRAVVQAAGEEHEVAPQRSRDLRDELALERALWEDEVARQRRFLNPAGDVGGTALSRLAVIAREVEARFDAVGSALEEGRPLPAEDVAALLSCADDANLPAWPIYSGAPPIPTVPRRHREPTLAATRPIAHTDPPSAELRAEARTRRGDKAATDERPSDPVLATAEALGYDPVALYGFVLNEIRPAHYFGAMKGPATTLRSGAGNDADQAALLAALLREAGYPARLAWGVVEISSEKLFNHFGVDNSNRLESVLTSAGIPWTPVLAGGRPRAYQLERVWCEAWVPYANFRGVVLDRSGSTWLGLDPQLKTMVAPPDRRVLDELAMDVEGFVGQYLDGVLCTGDLSMADSCPLPGEALAEQVEAYLADQGMDGSWATLGAARPVVAQDEDVLPAAMVGAVVAVNGFGIDLPSEFQHRVRLTARQGSRVLLETTVNVTDLAGREAVLWYAPATADDESVVAAFGGSPWRAPPYLVNVTPQVLVEGEELVRGTDGVGMGHPFDLDVTLTTPGGDTLSFTNGQLSGVPVAIGVAPGRQAYRARNGEPESTLEVLSTLANDYLDAQAAFEEELAALDALPLVHPFPSLVTIGSVVEPTGSFGLVEELEWRGVYVDADVWGTEPVGGEEERDRRWRLLSRLQSSALERRVFEDYGVASISADKALMVAAQGGVPILHIDQSNLGSIVPGLPYESNITDEITAWVLAGGEATVPNAALSYLEWYGVGYVLTDPGTGDARYQLAGGLSGAMIAVSPDLVPTVLREPLEYPSPDRSNPDPLAAVYIEVVAGNLQTGVAGEALPNEWDSPSGALVVRVTDRNGVPVVGATVTFSVLSGGGLFGGSPAAAVVNVESTRAGYAAVPLTLGEDTGENPFFTLLDPDDQYLTRCGLNLVTAEVNGIQLAEPFLLIAAPGTVTQLKTPRGTNFPALPNLLVSQPLAVVPADVHDNPVSNYVVTFTLQEGTSADPTEGPVLLTEEERCRADTILGQECGGSGLVQRVSASNGTWVWLVAGPSAANHVVVSGAQGELATTFTANISDLEVPGGPFVGEPTVIVAGRTQPRSSSDPSLSIEAYRAGTISEPLLVSVYLIREDYGVNDCGDNDPDTYCTLGLGTYATRRLELSLEHPACGVTGCLAGTVNEEATVRYTVGDQVHEVTSPDADGYFAFPVPLPTEAARLDVGVTIDLKVAVPRRPTPGSTQVEEACFDGDAPCGAVQELKQISIGEGPTFTLWSLECTMNVPEVVVLGHKMRLDAPEEFPYLIEPEGYAAENVVVDFLEDGSVVAKAVEEGRGPGTVQLLTTPVFSNPEGVHAVRLGVNGSLVWIPRPGVERSLSVGFDQAPFHVVQLDLDIDSDNSNGASLPDDSDLEETIEEVAAKYGKLVFVNHNDDDRDGKPDYADLKVAGEGNMVPLVLRLRAPPELWSQTTVKIYHCGTRDEEDLPGGQNVEPIPLGSKGGHEYYDYTPARKGALRVWNVGDPGEDRSASDYVVPGHAYSLAELGFDPGARERVLWIEAVAEIEDVGDDPTTQVNVKASFGALSVSRTVVLSPVALDLGVNNSGNVEGLRPGVPDADFDIDAHDDMVEDQGDGFPFWSSVQELVAVDLIEDLAPLTIDVPSFLREEGFKLFLELDLESSAEVVVFPSPAPPGDRLAYLKSPEVATAVGESWARVVSAGSRAEIELDDDHSELLFVVLDPSAGLQPSLHTLRLVAEEPERSGADDEPAPRPNRVVADAVVLGVRSIDSFWSLYSSRGAPGGAYDYPTESYDGVERQVSLGVYPDARHIADSGEVDLDRPHHLVFVHGFRVDETAAREWGRKVFKRLFWSGYRGNMSVFTWQGDQLSPLFAPNVENAFQTSPAFLNFLLSLQQDSSVDPEKITVMAHSLGNQVALDAMRLFRWKFPAESEPLLGSFVSVEAAVWPEALWPEHDVEYTSPPNDPGDAITYTTEYLKCMSWAFWFRQQDHDATHAVSQYYHSWAPADSALLAMRLDDHVLRNPTLHYRRPECEGEGFRVPIDGLAGGGRNLAHEMPVLMRLTARDATLSIFYSKNRLYRPLGMQPLQGPLSNSDDWPGFWSYPGRVGARDIFAIDFRWRADAHSDLKDLWLPEIYPWWQELTAIGAVPRNEE